MLSLTLSASVTALKPPPCIGFVCPEPSAAQSAVFFFSLYLIALGTGGIKPCVSSFGADQFDDTDPTERRRKGSFFNWSISVSTLVLLYLVLVSYGYKTISAGGWATEFLRYSWL